VSQVVVWLDRALGAAVAIGATELLSDVAQEPLSRVPFVTSIVLTLSLPDSEAARPYAIIVGHLASCVAGFVALWCFGSGDGQRGRRRVGGIVNAGVTRDAPPGRHRCVPHCRFGVADELDLEPGAARRRPSRLVRKMVVDGRAPSCKMITDETRFRPRHRHGMSAVQSSASAKCSMPRQSISPGTTSSRGTSSIRPPSH
jgi:hypothetical protein